LNNSKNITKAFDFYLIDRDLSMSQTLFSPQNRGGYFINQVSKCVRSSEILILKLITRLLMSYFFKLILALTQSHSEEN